MTKGLKTSEIKKLLLLFLFCHSAWWRCWYLYC